MSDGSRLLMIGLRGSGKTTYLAALWHLLESNEIPASLTLTSLQPDREYLNRIRNDWLRVKEQGRTQLRAGETVSLQITDAQGRLSVAITLPDISGESFRLQWAMRKASRTYAEYVSNCTGVLMFVHPASATALPSYKSLSQHAEPDDDEAWTPADTHIQLQLVELLQFVQSMRNVPSRLRISLIVSAWDLIKDPILPAGWLDARLPLLSQFLRANFDRAPFRIYGVSALGGDISKEQSRLISEVSPAKRVRIVERTLNPDNDITAPLRFLLGLDQASEDLLSAADA